MSARIIQEARLITFPVCAFAIIVAAVVAWVQVTPEPTDLPAGITPYTYQTLTPTEAIGGVQPSFPFGGTALGWSGFEYGEREPEHVELGIATGCDIGPPLRYCPKGSVTRAQMAIFLIRALEETPVDPPLGTFSDVPADNFAAAATAMDD